MQRPLEIELEKISVESLFGKNHNISQESLSYSLVVFQFSHQNAHSISLIGLQEDVRAGRSQVHQEDQDMSQALKEVRQVRVVASKVVNEAKKVQEDDRSRKYRAGYWIIFWYSINAVLEPIGMVPNKVCDATVFSLFIEHKYCSSQDLDRILDAFERDIPFIKTTAQATLAIERLRSNNGDSLDGGVDFSWNQSIIVFGQSGRNNPLFTLSPFLDCSLHSNIDLCSRSLSLF